ncbi:MAG TPA: serine/threonine-protein kinase [Polyangiales bacterium]|nr:serine/threonine-protein kinase [Polyangiales bacterium]
MARDSVLPPGTLLGLQSRYRLGGLLGRGGMGCVYDALDQKLDRDLAIKVLHQAADQKSLQRLYREARAAQLTEHDAVVQTYDCDADAGGRGFIVMERLHGEDLGKRLERGPLTPAEVLQIGLQLADVLRAAHDKKVIHRDLKPANVFLRARADENLLIKLLDFGIAKLTDWSALTTEGKARGTPEYMAPEYMANPRALDPRVDLYSLGVVLYEAASCKLPYGRHSVLELLMRHKHQSVLDIRQVSLGLPEALAAAIMRCLEPDPEQRFSDAECVYQALLRIAPRLS